MDTTSLRSAHGLSPPIKWSVYAGLYAFICGTAVAFLLSDLLVPLGDVLGLPTRFSLFVLASPALPFGAVVWWALVERRGSYTYRTGGAFGLLTALFTGLLWVIRFGIGWGLEMVLVIRVVVGFVLGVAVTVGVLTGLALMYARRRLADGRTDGAAK